MNKRFPAYFILLLIGPFLFNNFLWAQSHTHHSLLKIEKKEKKEEPIDQLLKRIDAAHIMLNQFDDKANTEFATQDIEKNLPRIESGMALVSKTLEKKNQWIDVNNLQMYAVLLSDIELQLNKWKTQLLDYNKELVGMNSDLKDFTLTRDSVLNSLKIDSNYRALIKNEMQGLSDKYGENEEAIRNSILKVNQMEAKISGLYYTNIELEDGIYDLNKNYWNTVTHKEAPYLWEHQNFQTSNSLLDSENKTNGFEAGNKTILENYFIHNQISYILLSIFGISFFLWVYLNYRRSKILQTNLNEGILSIRYLSLIPVIPSLVLILNITPFLDLDTPSLFFEFLQTLLIILLTYLIFVHWSRKNFFFWLGIVVLYLSLIHI